MEDKRFGHVWWVQCKPFAKEDRHSEKLNEFQQECLDNCFFGMGWRSSYFDHYVGEEYSKEIAEVFRSKVNSKSFTTAQNRYGQICEGDVVLTRLKDIYYCGRVTFKPKISSHERMTWYSQVERWERVGNYEELPHHIRGKLSSQNYQGTVAEIDGLSAITLFGYVGMDIPKSKIDENNFFKSIGDEDLEDLMACYMTAKNPNYVFLPCSCKKNTPGVEFIMYDPITDEKITCQTKVNRIIDIQKYSEEVYRRYRTIYLFSGAGYKNASLSGIDNIRIVEPSELFEVLKTTRYFNDLVSRYFTF